MARGKYEAPKPVKTRRPQSAKLITTLLAMVLILGCVVGGTVAWLIASTEDVVNTFTYGDINLKLEETDTELDDDEDPNTNDYEMLPGESITKDPKVTVLKESEASWLFVKLVESDNFGNFMEYEMAVDGEGNPLWTALNGAEGVYFRQVTAEEVAEADKAFWVLKDNTVNVKGEVTKEMLNALDESGAENYPTLTVTAYAVQYAGFEPEVVAPATEPTPEAIQTAAAAAWEKVVEAEAQANAPETTAPVESAAAVETTAPAAVPAE